MKLAKSLFAVTAVFALTFASFGQTERGKYAGNAVMHFYERLVGGDHSVNSEFERSFDYANAKISDKYRAERILSKAENERGSSFSRFAENKFTEAVSYGRTLDAEKYRDLLRDIYRVCNPSNGVDTARRSQAHRSDRPDPPAEELICKRAGFTHTLSADGSEWFYSDNYVFSVTDGRVRIVMRSPSGMTSSAPPSGTEFFVGKGCVSEAGIISYGVRTDGEFETEYLSLPYGGVCYVSSRYLSSPLLIYFTDKPKKPDVLY